MAQPARQAAATDDVRQDDLAETHRGAVPAADLSALMRSCRQAIEEERLYELRVPAASGRPAYVELPVAAEAVFTNNNQAVPLPEDDDDIKQFLAAYGSSLLCYGYPYLQYADGSIRPLFLMRAKVDDGVLQPDSDGHVKVNCSLLRDHGMEPSLIQGLAHKMADPTVPFTEKLAIIAKHLDLNEGRFNPQELDKGTGAGSLGRMRWCNLPILASATMPPTISALLRDLNELSQVDSQPLMAGTALGGIQNAGTESNLPDEDEAAARPHLDGPMVFDMHRLGYSQNQTVRAGMRHQLIAVPAPPGTGQMATMVNLIATAVMNGQSVLYAARRRDTVDAMTKHLNAWVGRKMTAVVRVGDSRDNEASREALVATLREIQRPEAEDYDEDDPDAVSPKEQKQASTREKPTLKDMEELDRLPAADTEGVEPLRAAHRRINDLGASIREEAVTLGLAKLAPPLRLVPCPNKQTLDGWREEFAILNGEKSAGLSKMMKGMLSRGGGRSSLLAAVSAAVNKLPPVISAQAEEALAGDDQLTAIAAGLTALGRYFEWRKLVAARDEAIRDLLRFKDCQTLEMLALNQSARKISGVRELYRDYWTDRLDDDPGVLENQVSAFFDLTGRRDEVDVNETRAHRSRRLAQAVGILAEQLPVWSTTLEDAGQALPLEPGYFDLVIIDEADLCDLGMIMPVLYRGKRAAVFGAARHDQRPSPLPPEWEANHVFVQGATNIAMAPTSLTALGNLSAILSGQGHVYQLFEHYRSHPRIAEFLSSTFYENEMLVQTNFRRLRVDAPANLLGLQWHHVAGRMAVINNATVNQAEIIATEKLIRSWVDAGVFRGIPRRSVGIATSIGGQADQIREFLKRGNFPDNVRERITVATPDLFLGRQVDFIVLLPGLAPDAQEALNQALAGVETLYHDVVGSARLGVHIIGDRDVCRDTGGFCAALSNFAEDPPALDENGEMIPDEFESKFDNAFGGKKAEAALNPWPILRQLLQDAGYPFQCNVVEGEQTLAVRLMSPLGGRYNIEIAAPLESVSGHHELEAERRHDEIMTGLNYQVLRLSSSEILEKSNYIIERLRRMV